MMQRRAFAREFGFLAIAASLCLLVAPGAATRADDADSKSAADLKAMEGEWTSKDDATGESTWSFKKDRLSLKTPSRAYECTVTLDPAAKPEKSIDFKATDDSPNSKGAMVTGIYKFDGETLLICFNGPEGERPKEFKNDFPKALLFELKKKK